MFVPFAPEYNVILFSLLVIVLFINMSTGEFISKPRWSAVSDHPISLTKLLVMEKFELALIRIAECIALLLVVMLELMTVKLPHEYIILEPSAVMFILISQPLTEKLVQFVAPPLVMFMEASTEMQIVYLVYVASHAFTLVGTSESRLAHVCTWLPPSDHMLMVVPESTALA